jgi:membrane protein
VSSDPAPARSGGVRRAARAAGAALGGVVDRPRDWVARGDPTSRRVVAVSWWRRYRAIDGPLQSLLLTVYVFLAMLPAILVLAEYLQRSPAALANHLVSRYHLTGSAAGMLRDVLVGDRTHELGSALFAIATVLIFGLGFGRVLQLVYTRAWGLDLRERVTDQVRYAIVMLVLFGLIAILLVQTTEIAGHPSWAGAVIAPGWFAVLLGYFVWAPRYLTHRRLATRDLLASAALTAVGIVVLMLVSTFAMAPWVDLYAKDFSGLGVFMALFFWLGLSSTVIVASASLSPVLAGRRGVIQAEAGAGND